VEQQQQKNHGHCTPRPTMTIGEEKAEKEVK